MILPIVAYGHQILRKAAQDIDKNYPDLDKLIENMFETMHNTFGVGLAASQINKSIKLIVLNADPYKKDYPEAEGFELVMINVKIIEESGEEWTFNEGCLSVPSIREDIVRKPEILVQYYDRDWVFHKKKFNGVIARIIQHEYDHIIGRIFTDKAAPLRKMLIRKQLSDISKGKVKVDYNMIFPKKKKKKLKIK